MPAKTRDNPYRIAFWTRHVAAWMRSPFNQREYCERHGLSRTMMSKWRVWLREDREREERIALMRKRRRGRISTRTKAISPSASVMAERLEQELDAQLVRRRRRFTDDEKRHILGLADVPGASFHAVAQAYDLAPSLLFRWRRELGGGADRPFSGFAEVSVVGNVVPDSPSAAGEITSPAPPHEMQRGGMEIALADGKRVRVEPGADPEAVRRLVLMLEGVAP